MNVFKILSTGDGKLDEPSVSAFLGYLLNPKADHGLNDSFLKLFLQKCFKDFNDFPLRNKKGEIQGLSILSNYDVEVILEQAFKRLVKVDTGEFVTDGEQEENDEVDKVNIAVSSGGEKINYVDIVIVIYPKLGRLNQTKSFNKELKAVILIENKIKAKPTQDQLLNQFDGARKKLIELGLDESEISNKMFNIYVTPDIETYKTHFTEFQNKNKYIQHLRWHEKDNCIAGESISSLMIELLNEEIKGNVDAIPEYTKHTIKSFVAFIKNDFRSYVDEEILSGNRTSDQRVIFERVKNEVPQLYPLFQEISYWIAETFPNIYPRMGESGDRRLSYGYQNKTKGYTYTQFQVFTDHIIVRIKKDTIKENELKKLNDMLDVKEIERYYEKTLSNSRDFESVKELLAISINNQIQK